MQIWVDIFKQKKDEVKQNLLLNRSIIEYYTSKKRRIFFFKFCHVTTMEY
jgi:hypothetical protein